MSEKENHRQQLVLDFPAYPEYTFANFIVSPGSQFAFNSAVTMCAEEYLPYSSLYISGGKGLGKTHLLIAIGNMAAERNKQALYIHCRDFVRRVRENDATAVADMVKKLADVDFFLIDDVDEIVSHPEAQKKLYFIINTLMENKGKIVFTGTLNPNQYSATETFLTSRMRWGMTAELKPLDEAGMTVLMKIMAANIGLEIPDKIATYLLHRIPRDFQTIKKTLELINRESYVQKKKVSIPLVKTILS